MTRKLSAVLLALSMTLGVFAARAGTDAAPAAAYNSSPAYDICMWFKAWKVPTVDGRASVLTRWTNFSAWGQAHVGCTYWDGQFGSSASYRCLWYNRVTNVHAFVSCPTPP